MRRPTRFLVMSLIALLPLLLGACASSPSTRTVRVLDAEHNDRRVVVVKTRPAASRQCWKHGRHWHCRRA